ncbi:TolB family protein [Tengunoibacter tsumagoiensis]|uniref:Uncharacterized protein n=1 Tax=Tengunoibacter tsumagoiensis TaxID=2014871 RepID=A0A402A4H6_9CHLR|nr:PD40 domain-containing protein [Tengunoibacter tsumagoiensis]GCE14012.1 hypothetical protein KTT_38710 [Tengunoibacter tsumagoiensis]
MIIFTSLFVSNLAGLTKVRATVALPSLQALGGKTLQKLVLPADQELFYAGTSFIFSVPTAGGAPRILDTPGYRYNRSTPPLLLPDGRLVYGGTGIWLFDPGTGQRQQLASIADGDVLTSLVTSSDGTQLAWSSAPIGRSGKIEVYAGPLTQGKRIYQQVASQCPCFRAFSYANSSAGQANSILLLTNDRSDHRLVQYGLWALDLTQSTQPYQILQDAPQQGPLAYVQAQNLLLSSSYEGFVPLPTDRSAPGDMSSFSYANSLTFSSLNGTPLQSQNAQTFLAEQGNLSNSAVYHWVTSPFFSPDGKQLAYVEFSSDSHDPFTRHSALYIEQVEQNAVTKSTAGRGHGPGLVATSTSRYVELGGWLDEHTLLFYADNALYAFDLQQGALTQIVSPGAYVKIIGVGKKR